MCSALLCVYYTMQGWIVKRRDAPCFVLIRDLRPECSGMGPVGSAILLNSKPGEAGSS